MNAPTRVLARTVLVFEALVVFFAALVARAVSDVGGPTALAVGGGLAVALLLTTGLLRWSAGYVVGSVLQVGVVATAVVVPEMLVLGLIFAGFWAAALLVGRTLGSQAAETPGDGYAPEP